MQVIGQDYEDEIVMALINSILSTSMPAHSHVKLVAAPFTPTPTSDPTTFTEATFAGYAPIDILTYGVRHGDSANQWFTFGETPPLSFVPSGTLSPTQTIYGYFVEDPGGNMVCAEVLSTPFVMRNTGTVLQLLIPFGVGPLKMSATVLP
jgi:hypothetical protein